MNKKTHNFLGCRLNYEYVLFFQKLIDQGQSGGTPQFLSTHPDPGNRVQAITDKWIELGSKPGVQNQAEYTTFKSILPQ